MENKKLSEIIKELTEQISLKEISTRDFVEEMKILYDRIDIMEIKAEDMIRSEKSIREQNDVLCKTMEEYRKEFVVPAKELEKQKIDLKYEHLDWKMEKKYIEKECKNLKSIIASLTALRTMNSSGPNGEYHNVNVDKPILE